MRRTVLLPFGQGVLRYLDSSLRSLGIFPGFEARVSGGQEGSRGLEGMGEEGIWVERGGRIGI